MVVPPPADPTSHRARQLRGSMKSESRDLKHPRPAKSSPLGRAHRKSENVKDAVAQAADELVSVNEALKQDSKGKAPAQTIKDAIAQNVDVEHKVAKAADDLNQVNTQLAKQVAKQASVASELAETKSRLAQVRDDLSESQTQERDARQKALQDSLTGLPNRASFDQALDHGLIQARRHAWKLAVLFIDIDEFKSINDTYGHDMGDEVLRMVANRLQSSLREEDTVCRWGGDEFVCLLLEVKQEADLSRLADKLLGRIAEDCELNGTVLSVKASIGIALYPADGETAESLFKNADTAMLRAKGTKKNVVLFHESSLTVPGLSEL
jgi:diguanylate cyclase